MTSPRIYFMLEGNRLAVADADGFRSLGAPDDQFFKVVTGPDGTAWINSKAGIVRHDAGDRLTRFEVPELDRARAAAVGPDGALWVVTADQVARHAGGTWTTWSASDLGGKPASLDVAPDGTIVARSNDGLAIHRDGAWARVPAPDGRRLTSVSITPAGDVLVGAGAIGNQRKGKGAVYRLDAGTLVKVVDVDVGTPLVRVEADGSVLIGTKHRYHQGQVIATGGKGFSFAVGPDGADWARGGDRVLTVRQPDGETRRVPAKGTFEFPVRKVHTEPGGRVWVLLEAGLAVIDTDGTIHDVPPGTIPALQRGVRWITTAGTGPATLPAFPSPRRFTIRGRFVDVDGAGVAGIKVEMCPLSTSTYYGKSPCAGRAPLFRATSGADGAFEITDAPGGGLGIAFKVKNEWFHQLTYRYKIEGDVRTIEDLRIR